MTASLAGVVSHLRWTENLWFEIVLLGRPAEGPQFEGPEDADMMVEGIPLGQLLEITTGNARCRRDHRRAFPR